MLKLFTTNQFEKDLKRMKKRGKELGKLWRVTSILLEQKRLDSSLRHHKLSGNYRGHWECHIEPNWLLIYRKTLDNVILVGTGTHSDLFKQ